MRESIGFRQEWRMFAGEALGFHLVNQFITSI
ncbi:MAG: hypothetical protein EZS28_022817, partial [Streblomastix strix]